MPDIKVKRETKGIKAIDKAATLAERMKRSTVKTKEAAEHEVYADYTDQIEPYGMDECWLDVSGSIGIRGNGEKIANEIRERMKFELGLSISVGVSFNKIFAKLGSDMKKPDATTLIPEEAFREKIWGLPASDLLGVGQATEKILSFYGIKTIGQLAAAPPELLRRRLGKYGLMIIQYANGKDHSPVANVDYEAPVKSVGHGITTKEDLENSGEVFNIMLALMQDVGHKLRVYKKNAGGVAIDIRNSELFHQQWQCQIPPTHSTSILAREAFSLFLRSYRWEHPIRSITVRVINLSPQSCPQQIDLWRDIAAIDKMERFDSVVEHIRDRFGKYAIMPATLCRNIKMPTDREVELRMPTGMIG